MWYRGGSTPVAILMVAMTFMAVFYAPVSCEPVNVALNKNVEAQYTCGFYGAEQYYDHKYEKVSPQQRNKLTCASVNMHPPSALVDGSTDTKWQSTSRLNIYTQTNLNVAGPGDLEAILKIDLQQDFLVEKIIIRLEDSLRPDRIAVSKSNDGNQYIPWAYKVTEQDDCSGKFSSSFKPLPTSSGDTVCTTYPKPLPQTFEVIEFDFSSVAPELREWRRVKYLEMRFYKMPLVFAVAGTAFQHYSISELEVMAECSCNGQQIGCKQDNTTKEYVCECGGNTKGQFCEMCMPFFNQKPFEYGVPCESCNCMNHATECSYDKDIDAAKQSINSTGQKSGGGKCLDCQDFTAGINCENCSPFYYRPVNKSQTDKDACVSCGCSSLGSDVNPVSGLVADCIMNNEKPLNSGQNPGDCFCKKNVIGSKCDTCKEGFFNLRVDNNEGCEECSCFTSGTVGGSTVCAVDSIGQCQCKANVENRKCDICKDGFYNLDANNAEGCTSCGCDAGGSLSMICDKTFGKCSCRPNINASKCDMPNTGFYYPDVHFISAEFESGTGDASLSQEPQYAGYKGYGYADLKSGNVVGVNMVIPGGTRLSSKFIFVIRYRSTQAASGLLKIKGSDIPESTVDFPACSTGWCYVNTLSIRSDYTLPLTATITIRVQQPILLDQIVALPVEFNNPDLSLVVSSFGNDCNVLENSIGGGNVTVENLCKKSIYSMTTFYLNGALPCKCDPEGSFSTDCSQYGGVCSCKAGVGGRKCDECQPGFYDLSNTGCKPCDCKGTNKFCNKGTGQCECPPNTIGRTCDQCAIYHWNWNSTVGCQPCGCDTTGSIQRGCNSATGICACKIGVQGEKCNECIDNYKGFSSSGCSSCLCSTVGSNNTVCNKTSGQCSCKSNVAGLSCDKCSDTSFYLNGNNEQGCLDCICMGITKTCSSSSQRVIVISTLLTTNSGTGGQLKSSRKLSNNQGVVNENIVINVITSDTTPYLSVTFNASSTEYWMAPDDLKGNLLNLYGTTIDIEILYAGNGEAMPPQAIMVGRKGRYSHDFGTSITADKRHSLSIPLSEKSWVKEGTATVLSRSDFILAISEVEYILLPASFLSGEHTSNLYRMVYSKKETVGSVNPSVENCICGDNYTGLSCESCAEGYKRENVTGHPYLGICTKCECNNHATKCNPTTGECLECQDQTTGSNCESCKAGFYGDATLGTPNDCKECTCYKPRVANSTCDIQSKCLYCNEGYTGDNCDNCDTFYYGNPQILYTGTCKKCDCNGNSESCANGLCIDCRSNTFGEHCERCKDGFFGNATMKNCSACECDSTGSIDTAKCDYDSGQCSCHSGVGTRQCSACKTGYWGFGDTTKPGCLPCECVEAGSQTLQCNDNDGKCTCKPNTSGDKCSTCNDGYFGLPLQPCESCNCNSTGTEGGINECDKTTGQCRCKPGIGGRQCDECMKFYTGFSTTGCTACGDCQYSLGNDTLKQIERYEGLWNNTQKISAIQEQDVILQNLQLQLNTSLDSLGITENNFGSLLNVTGNLTSLESTSDMEINNFIEQVSNLEVNSQMYKNKTDTANVHVMEMVTRSNVVQNKATSVAQMASDYDFALTTQNTTAYQQISQGIVNSGTVDLDFTNELQKAMNILAQIKDTSGVGSMKTKVAQQAEFLQSLKSQSSSLETDIKARMQSVLDREAQLASLLSNETNIKDAQTTARTNMIQTEELINETNSLISKADNETTAVERSLELGKTDVANYVLIRSQQASSVLQGEILPLPTGYNNYINGAVQLRNELMDTRTALSPVENSVNQADTKAQSLMNEAQLLNNTFIGVKERGDNAVDAIQSYEKVKPVLDDAFNLSVSANQTIQNSRAVLAGITVMNLETIANLSKINSEALRTEYSDLNYESDVMKQRVDSANASLQQSIIDWNVVESLITQMNSSAVQLKVEADSNTIDATVASGLTDVMAAETKLNTLTINKDSHDTFLNGKENEINTLKNLSTQGNKLIEDIAQGLNGHNNRVDNIKNQIAHVDGLRSDSNSLKQSLDDKVRSIKSKIEEAKLKLQNLKQPVHFNGSSAIYVTNPINNVNQKYNDISLEFRKESGFTDGLIFFAENTAAGAELAIELVNGKVTFDYDTNLDPVSIQSPAIICDGCWARVLASRYGNTGLLTVTILSTSGRATSSGTGQSSSDSLTLNSPLMFGGLPSAYETNKVRSRGFLGCIQNAYFETESINLWQEAITKGREPSCCRQPLQTTPNNLDPGVSLDGSGYMVFSSTALNLVTRSSLYLTIKFRTFNPHGTVLLVANADQTTKYSLYLKDGNVVFQYGNTSNMFTVTSLSRYNTGKWIEVIAEFTTSQMMLETKIIGEASSTTDKVTIGAVSVSLVALTDQDLIIGTNVHPNTVGYTRSIHNFAGCLKDLRYGDTAASLADYSLTTGFTMSLGISTKGCFKSVINGISFTSSKSTVELNAGNSLPSFQNVEFTLITENPKGLLLYVQAASGAKKLYVCLFHGNIIIFYQENNQRVFTITTTDVYLSDGQEHNIQLNVAQSKAQLTVDSKTYESKESTPFTSIQFTGTNTFYLGGVPDTISLPTDFFVKQAIIGSIRNLKVNSLLLDVFASDVIVKLNSLDLSGILTPSGFVAPIPYTTTSAPSTVAPPTCAPITVPAILDSTAGVWFDGKENENLNYASSVVPVQLFKSSFVLSMTFQSFSQSGILFYMSDTNVAQTEWFMVYLKNGYLHTAFSGKLEDKGTTITYDFKSDNSYNDGKKYQVDFLRLNNFLALVETTRKDYANNAIQVTQASTLTIGSNVYIGGINQDIGRTITPIQAIQENVNFVGAVYHVEVKLDAITYTFNLRNASQQSATKPIYSNVLYGVSLDGVNSYVKLENPLTQGQIQFKLGFRTRQKTANLLTIYESSDKFVVLDLLDGKIRVLIASSTSSNQSFISTSSDVINVCDYNRHDITVTVGMLGVGIQIDSNINQINSYPLGLTPPVILNRPVYIGGLEDRNLVFPDPVSVESLRGCIESFTLQGVDHDLTEKLKSSKGLTYACPL